MSTPNDEEAPAAPSKDISDMIQVTNELASIGDASGEEEEGETPDCFFPNCPIDLDETTKNIKGALDEHVVPKVDETRKSIVGAYDVHVGPKVDETTKSIVGAYEEHVVPKVEETTKSIQGALDEHVVPKIEMAKENSIRTMETITTGSQRILTEVQENSKKGMEEVQKQSQAFLESSKSTMDGVAVQTKAIVDEKIVPEFQKMVETSQGVVQKTAEEAQTYAPCYMGTAPGFTDLTTNNAPTTPWYFVLLEACFRAFGRVVFCDNPVTGIFIWLAILFASPLGAFCSMLSVMTANATAMYLDLDTAILASGQYARNAVLIGTGIVDCFAFDFPETGNLKSGVSILIFLSVALAPATVVVESIWMQKFSSSIPSLLFPFNIVFVATIVCAKVWNFAMATQILLEGPAVGMLLDEIEKPPSKLYILEALFNGLSKIFFVEGGFTGFLILVGVLFCSRIVAASLLAGSFVSSFVLGYMVFEENHWYLDAGYAGFNPALCVAGIFYYFVPSWKLSGLAFFALVATVIVQGAVDVVLGILGIPVSTSLGFCFTLIALLAMDLVGDREDYFIRTISEAELSTPEDYLKSMDVTSNTESSSDEDDVEKALNEETPLMA
mmetsp:Transcript_12607/g.31761  ORF Transcript_12607/g.31761 Transcript_12607/m.31761 type:complete len:612 (-) Transcript_12607:227-2062(-)